MLKILLKILLCKHKYQPIRSCSFLDEVDKRYDTWYEFECMKCGKSKRLKTYGIDKILNSKKIKIEDKKIRTIDTIDYCHSTDTSKDMVLVEKINEIIDKLNSMEE